MFALWLALSANISSAAQDSVPKHFIGLGGFADQLNRVTSASTGAISIIGPFYFPVIYQYRPIPEGLGWFGQFALPPLGSGDADGGSRTFLLTSTLFGFYNFSPVGVGLLEVKAGLVMGWYIRMGLGGTSVQNNGNSTSTFYFPQGISIAVNYGADVGMAFRFGPRVRLDLDVIFWQILARPATAVMAGLSFGWQ